MTLTAYNVIWRKARPGGLLAALAALALACGTEVGNPKKPTGDDGDQPAASVVLSDLSVANEVVSSTVDDAVDAATDDVAGAVSNLSLTFGGLSLTDAALNLAAEQRQRKCEKQTDGSALVTVEISGQWDKDVKRPKVSISYHQSGTETYTNRWTKTGGTVECNAAGLAARVDWSQPDGLSLVSERTRHREQSMEMTAKNGTSRKRSAVYDVTGKRTTSWSHLDVAGAVGLRAEVSGDIKRKATVAKMDGSKIAMESQVATKSGSPLAIETVRDKTTHDWVSRTIKSGTVVTTQTKDSRMESTFSGVTITPDGGCMPVSGAITGSIFRLNGDTAETKASRTFTVTFEDGQATIKYDNGDQAAYEPDRCRLEE